MRASLAVVLSSCLVACGSRSGSTPSAQAPPVAAPPLAVSAPAPSAPVLLAIVIDQLAAWVADERLAQLPEGGFSRLRREGTWLHALSYLHASTETAPGHAALFTGRLPRDSGIVGNAVWREGLGRASQIEDPSAHLVDENGVGAARGVSLALLARDVPTLADALKARDSQAVVIALSLKDRGAIFGGGRHPTLSAWHDEKSGSLVTSDALFEPRAAARLPDWARALARPQSATSAVEWSLLEADRPFVGAHARLGALAVPDAQPGESTDFGGNAFPHRLMPDGASPEKSYRAFRGTPQADHWLVDLALAAVEHARDPAHPLLLTLSFSTNDYVGHAFGPHSWEAWEELLRLNVELARLFDALDARLGSAGYSVVLSGDHGVAPLPELLAQAAPPWCAAAHEDAFERPCEKGVRLHEDALRAALAKALEPAFSPPPLRALVESVVYLTDDARRLPPAERAKLDALIVTTLRANAAVADVIRLADFERGCPPLADESPRALVCRSVLPGFGDYYVIPKRGSFVFGAELGTSHGTPYRYDRTVPLLVRYARGGRAGATRESERFGAFYASAWYALTAEKPPAGGEDLGGVVGLAD